MDQDVFDGPGYVARSQEFAEDGADPWAVYTRYGVEWDAPFETYAEALEQLYIRHRENGYYVPPPTRTLPGDSTVRKNYPVYSGAVAYFPAALAGVASHSKKGNDKHNPGEPLHHARGKSMDHEDCIVRHIIDLGDLLAAYERGESVSIEEILEEADALSWRALALSQKLYEELGGKPLAPGAKE